MTVISLVYSLIQPLKLIWMVLAQHKVSLSNLIENVSSIDNTDGSESFTLRITGLAKDFNLGGPATVLVTGTGEERVWVIKPTDLNHVFITVPENYSGNVNFKVAGVSTENDGDSKTGALTDVNFISDTFCRSRSNDQCDTG